MLLEVVDRNNVAAATFYHLKVENPIVRVFSRYCPTNVAKGVKLEG